MKDMLRAPSRVFHIATRGCSALALLLLLPAANPVAPGESDAPLTIGRLHYEGGGDWYANPSSLPNLAKAVAQRTSLKVALAEKVVTLNSEDLWSVPFLHMTGHGNVHFSDTDLITLRRWLQQGGSGS